VIQVMGRAPAANTITPEAAVLRRRPKMFTEQSALDTSRPRSERTARQIKI